MQTNNTVTILDHLVIAHNDRIEGYKKALKNLKKENDDLKEVFYSIIAESFCYKTMLTDKFIGNQSNFEVLTSFNSKFYIKWNSVRKLFKRQSRVDVLAQCKTIEDDLQKAYISTLKHELPYNMKQLITGQFASLKSSYEFISNMYLSQIDTLNIYRPYTGLPKTLPNINAVHQPAIYP